MFCPQCGNNIKDGAWFCGNCGWAVTNAPVQNVQPAEPRCASCGTVLKEGARFCPNCGAAVSATPAIPAVQVVSEPVLSGADTAAKEAVNSDKPESEKNSAIDKAVFYHLGNQIYACYLYKDGSAVGNMTDTQGAFITGVKEWLEKKYDNLIVEIKEKE